METEVLNLKESKEKHMKGLHGGKGRKKCCSYNLKNKEKAFLIKTDNNTDLWTLTRLFRRHFIVYIIPM